MLEAQFNSFLLSKELKLIGTRKVVASPRLELGRPSGHWILSPTRLPIPPRGHGGKEATL
jgi:hypothetical protein